MVDYRRNYVAGGTFAFTLALKDRRSALLVEYIDALRSAFQNVKRERPYETIAAAVLPDHLHAIWTLPDGDHDYSTRWRLIKTQFTKSLAIPSPWQRRFWEHTIRDERDLQNHVDYIHFNPVKHAHVPRASEWPHSSIHRFIERGDLASDWAAPPAGLDAFTSERDAH